ncbi:MAG: 23S rRNA (guanosine(2251)-2'-O)-methyltransferase RlmB [Bacteroidales bacterium]|nr:23S rRNA (guanosine(2251)-2'-O)-methyltransferase RlmB [Bacteroidales bacterium]
MKEKAYIFGIHPCLEAISSGKEIEKVFIRKGLSGDGFQELFSLIRKSGTPYQMVPLEKLNRITRKNHQGVIALTSMVVYMPIDEVVQRAFESGETPLVIALDSITDVRNMGAIARSAEIAGAHALLVPDKGSAQLNADAMKSSAGALNIIPVCRTSSFSKTLVQLRESGLKIVGASEKGNQMIYDSAMTEPLVIVMGSEDTGLSDNVLRICDDLVKIPHKGQIKSLNVSVAAAVLLFEAVRQRFTPE